MENNMLITPSKELAIRGRSQSPVPNRMETSLQAYPEMDHVAVESSKKNFLHTWSEYIENLKKATEMSERCE